MKAWVALLAGVGVPMALSAILYALSRAAAVPSFEQAARLGLKMSLFMGPLGAVLGILAARRPHAEAPLRDAIKTSSIIPAMITLPAVLLTSNEQGVLAALVVAPFAFLPGPVAGGIAAWLARWTPPAAETP
ncbi:MAG TPA: hypothetical protein VF950_03605 [Planctomycetota bacterium]